MTEQEAIEQLKFDMEMITFEPNTGEYIPLEVLKNRNDDNYKTYLADEVAIKALEEIQKYLAIGRTPNQIYIRMGGYIEELSKYAAIGTPDECRAAVEKQKEKKPIRNDKCTCPSCGTHNEVWKKRRNTVPSDIVYCWHCGQAVEIMRSDEERD